MLHSSFHPRRGQRTRMLAGAAEIDALVSVMDHIAMHPARLAQAHRGDWALHAIAGLARNEELSGMKSLKAGLDLFYVEDGEDNYVFSSSWKNLILHYFEDFATVFPEYRIVVDVAIASFRHDWVPPSRRASREPDEAGPSAAILEDIVAPGAEATAVQPMTEAAPADLVAPIAVETADEQA